MLCVMCLLYPEKSEIIYIFGGVKDGKFILIFLFCIFLHTYCFLLFIHQIFTKLYSVRKWLWNEQKMSFLLGNWIWWILYQCWLILQIVDDIWLCETLNVCLPFPTLSCNDQWKFGQDYFPLCVSLCPLQDVWII